MIGSSQSLSAKGNDAGFTLSANAVGRAMSMQFLGDHVNAQSSRTQRAILLRSSRSIWE